MQFRPAITTFSDHVVLSYRPGEVPEADSGAAEVVREIEFQAHLEHCQRAVAEIALAALELGLLVRGGLTIGPIFHEHDVDIGPAMLEAYHLESKISAPLGAALDRLLASVDVALVVQRAETPPILLLHSGKSTFLSGNDQPIQSPCLVGLERYDETLCNRRCRFGLHGGVRHCPELQQPQCAAAFVLGCLRAFGGRNRKPERKRSRDNPAR